MLRKIFLLAAMMAVAIAATATTAAAQVEVHNSGDIEIHAELSLALGQHTPIGFVAGISCQQHWLGSVSHEGHVSLFDVNIDPHPGDIGDCESMNDCDDLGWEGQLVEASGQTVLHQHFCLILPGSALSGVPVKMECVVAPGGASAHCDSPVLHEPTGNPVAAEMVGEVNIEPPLDIEHSAD